MSSHNKNGINGTLKYFTVNKKGCKDELYLHISKKRYKVVFRMYRPVGASVETVLNLVVVGCGGGGGLVLW